MENLNLIANTSATTSFINLTPHEVKVLDQNGQIQTIPASGEVARISTSFEVM